MNIPDDADLYQLYGNMANVRTVPIRNVCRQRIEGHNDWFTRTTLQDHAAKARVLAAQIEAKGGAGGAIARCEHIADVLEYWADKPAMVHRHVRDVYQNLHADPTEERPQCPFEENANKRACWSCHAPKQVWKKLEESYDSD